MQYSDTVIVSDLTRGDLKNLIQTGESSFLEFKHSVASPEKIAREIAAFANTKGGTILIGVEDNGEIVGVESYYEEEFWLNQAAREECIPEVPVKIELVNTGERDVDQPSEAGSAPATHRRRPAGPGRRKTSLPGVAALPRPSVPFGP
jgi:hypothetical protein